MMAKKNARDVERRARVEQMRREQQRKERSRSFAILGACVVLVVGLLAAALIPYVKHQREQHRLDSAKLSDMGVSASAAGCDAVKTEKNTLKLQKDHTYHVPIGTKVNYAEAPPAFGYHWGNFLSGSEIRTFYTRADRPEVERLVHSLEHGHTILWYDDSIKTGSEEYKQIQQMGDKLGLDSYFMAAPWTSGDGGTFPSGKHVALTHWTSANAGVTQYCAKPSGEVVGSFVKKYPKQDSTEPGAI
jgi:hypothetical protein